MLVVQQGYIDGLSEVVKRLTAKLSKMRIVPKRFHSAMSFDAGGDTIYFFSGAREKIYGVTTGTFARKGIARQAGECSCITCTPAIRGGRTAPTTRMTPPHASMPGPGCEDCSHHRLWR